jgi:hypothetical protein
VIALKFTYLPVICKEKMRPTRRVNQGRWEWKAGQAENRTSIFIAEVLSLKVRHLWPEVGASDQKAPLALGLTVYPSDV